MWSPFVMLLVLAGLVSVPKYLYEAAEIDRAGAWRRFRTITFPYIRSLLLLALLFRTIETFKMFDIVYRADRGRPGLVDGDRLGLLLPPGVPVTSSTSQASALGYIMLFAVIVLTSLYLYAIQARRAERDCNEQAASRTHRHGRLAAHRWARRRSAWSISSRSVTSS